MFKKKHVPYSTVIELTLKCNMNCIHCGSSAGNKRNIELSTNQWIDVITDLNKLSCNDITLIGGEAFLRKDWFAISKHIKDLGMKLSIVTNGYAIDKVLVDQLVKLKLSGIAISIDGASPTIHDKIRGKKGSFDKCSNALKLLLKAGIPTGVITTVHKMNLKDLTKLRNFLMNKGVAWQIQMADTIGRFPKKLHLSKEEFYSVALFIASTKNKYSSNELLACGAHCIGYHSQILPYVMLSPIWKGCQAGISVLGIQSNGNVKGCLSLPDEFIEGNIKKTKISKIWNNPNAFSYNRRFTKNDLKGDCKDCKYGTSCKGGCGAVSTSLTGKLHSDPFCLYLIEKQTKAAW